MGENRAKALTLIELMVSIAIVALIGGVVLIAYGRLASSKLDVEARKLWMDLALARQLAVSSDTHYGVKFDVANRSYAVYQTPEATVSNFTADNRVKGVGFSSEMTVTPGYFFVYAPHGNLSASPVITLSVEGKTRSITGVNETGYFILGQ